MTHIKKAAFTRLHNLVETKIKDREDKKKKRGVRMLFREAG